MDLPANEHSQSSPSPLYLGRNSCADNLGQIISELNFGVLNFPKYQQKKFDKFLP